MADEQTQQGPEVPTPETTPESTSPTPAPEEAPAAEQPTEGSESSTEGPATPTETEVKVVGPDGNVSSQEGPVAPAVHVDNKTARTDEDAYEGSMVVIVNGEHEGLRGALVAVESRDPKTGYPVDVIVRNRDPAGDADLVSVAYADVRPAA